MTNYECIHGLTSATCSLCKATSSPTVFFSAGGRKYHFDKNCRTFLEGRQIVSDRGGVNAPIETGPEYLVRNEKDPCRNCVKTQR